MELKVWFDGLPRIVCGVNEKTTCQDIVFALAQATGKTGRFTLIERWRNKDRLLAPSEVVMKWGEHSSDVQYILQCAAIDSKNGKTPLASTSQGDTLPKTATPPQEDQPTAPPPYRNPPSPGKPIRNTGKELPPYRLPPPPTLPQAEPTDRTGAPEPPKSKEEAPPHEYKELIYLINRQRQKLTAQQAELTKHDAEIMFWETKARMQERNMETIVKEIGRLEVLSLQNEAQVMALREVEQENDALATEAENLRRDAEKLRLDLLTCDEELTHSKNIIRFLEESLVGAEVESLRRAVVVAREETEAISAMAGSLEAEFSSLESSLGTKRAEMEVLVSAMKEANLESLGMGEEESLFRSRRRIRGPARQLKDAAPTATNPHGVWV